MGGWVGGPAGGPAGGWGFFGQMAPDAYLARSSTCKHDNHSSPAMAIDGIDLHNGHWMRSNASSGRQAQGSAQRLRQEYERTS